MYHLSGFVFLWIAYTLGKYISKKQKYSRERLFQLPFFPNEWWVLVPSLLKSAAKPMSQVLTVPLYILVRAFP